MNRFDLYRWCVQDAPRMARFLTAVHGPRPAPRRLREDFAGPAGLSAAWVHLSPSHRAVAVDRDPEPLRHAEKHERVTLRRADVRRARDKADVIALLNFGVCELHDRKTLVAYFRHLRTRLLNRGVVVLDIYGGRNAFTPGQTRTFARTPDGRRIGYTWQQRTADPVSGMVVNAIHLKLGARVWLKPASSASTSTTASAPPWTTAATSSSNPSAPTTTSTTTTWST
jgi:hypothetical protein